jgi:hypothetical protein
VNALRTAKVRAPPRVYVAALKFGLVLALEVDMDKSVGEYIRRLEEQLQRLTESNMENKALAERNRRGALGDRAGLLSFWMRKVRRNTPRRR